MKKNELREICVDFGDSKVIKKSEKPVWNAFRIWESVSWPIRQNTNYYKKLKRTINVTGNPPFDIFSDWLMDFATISAGQLGRRDWENFRNLVLIQFPLCPSECWYCFNDAWKDNPDCDFDEVRAKKIIERFLLQQEQNTKVIGEQNNVLRISGGEPFTQPKLIKDIAVEIADKIAGGNSIFLWVDTNLIKVRNKQNINEALKALSKLKNNVAIHACFHGVTDSSIKRITGKRFKIRDLIDNYMHIIKKFNINIYPRFNPCACTPAEAEEFFLKLYEEYPPSPSKLYLGIVELNYQPSKDRLRKRIEKSKNDKEKTPIYYSPQATIYWWDRMMYEAYGVGYGIVPRHLCNCLSTIKPYDLKKRVLEIRKDRPDKEFIFVSKGFFRENYALKVLEALALPNKFRIVLELENKYVEPNFQCFVNEYSDIHKNIYKNKDILIVATDSLTRDVLQMVFLRWAKLKKIWTTPSSTNIEAELSFYPYLEKPDEYLGNQEKSFGAENYENIARYVGRRNLPISGYYLQLATLPENNYPIITRETSRNEKNAFFQIINWINEFKKNVRVFKNVYYRVSKIRRLTPEQDIEPNEDGILEFKPGDDIEIQLDSYNPYLGRQGYPKEDQAIINISCTAEENVNIVSPENIRLSKFGQPIIKLRIKRIPTEFKGEIVIKPARSIEEVRIIELRLPFITKVRDILNEKKRK